MGTESIYKNTTFLIGGLQTPNGSAILTSTGTITLHGGGIKTSAGTVILSASGDLNADAVSNYIVALPFMAYPSSQSLTTYACIGGSFSAQITGVAGYAQIPFAGSVLAIGCHINSPRTAGNLSVTAMNGGTVLLNVAINSTNVKRVTSAVATGGTYPFTANNLRVRIKSDASLAPTVGGQCSGLVWVIV
jgi:hypothetical protein